MTEIKKTLGYAVFVTILVYAITKRIPIYCFGCDTAGWWARCIDGSGPGTQSCEAYKAAESRVEFALDITEKAKEYLYNSWDFTKEKLPGIISDFIETLKDQLLALKDRMQEQMVKIIDFLKEKIGLFVSKAKDIAVSAYDRYLKKVVDAMTTFVTNNLITPIYNVIQNIIDFRNLVWEKLSEVVQRFADLDIGKFVGDVVDLFNKIPELIGDLKVKIVDMVNGVSKKVVNKINDGVNGAAEGIERVVDKVSDLSDTIVDKSEDLTNTIILRINNVMNGVERRVDNITGGIETTVNNTVRPVVNGLSGAVNSARNWEKWNMKPLSFLPVMGTFDGLDIPNLDIPNVPDVNFPEIEFSVDIPTVNIPQIPEIDPDSIKLPTIPGFGFITDKIAAIKTSIVNIFERAMDPLYTAIAAITLLIGNVVTSIQVFYENYLSWEAIKTRAVTIMGQVKDGVKSLVNFVIDDILPAYLKLLLTFWTHVYEFVKKVSESAWKFVKKLGELLKPMFNEVYKAVIMVTGAVAKGVFGTTMYVAGTTVDKYTAFLPMSLSVKMMSIFAIIIWMFTGQFFKNGKNLFDLVFNAVYGGMVILSDADALVDAAAMNIFPSLRL